MLLLLGKSIGTSKYTILASKFVKKSGSEIRCSGKQSSN